MTESTDVRQENEYSSASVNEHLQKRCDHKYITIPSEDGCVSECIEANEPELGPCFELVWGDSDEDKIETDDFEVMYIVARNPYENVTLKDVTVIRLDLKIDGYPPKDLPDGQPSVMLIPSKMIGFGDLKPGSGDSLYSVAREIALVSKGAKWGEYRLRIFSRYTVEFDLYDKDYFELNLVRS